MFHVLFLQDQTQKVGDIVLHAFDPVTVRLSLNSDNIQHEKFVMQLVKPHVQGFSVPPLNEDEGEEMNKNEGKKRKSKEDVKKKSKRKSKS